MQTKPVQILSILLPVVAVTIIALVYWIDIPLYCYVVMLFGTPLFIYLVSTLISHLVNTSTEYLGAYVINITHYEDWDEKVLKHRQVEDGKDSNGMPKYRTETYYETVYHPDVYEYCTNTGKCGEITYETFDYWCELLNDQNPTFIDMFRDYDTIDGDAWEYTWDGSLSTMIPLTYRHRYYNPFKYSESIYHSIKIDKNTVLSYGLVEHPKIYEDFYQHCVVGQVKEPLWDMRVQRLNAKLGSDNQFRLFVVIFDGNKSTMNTFQMQKAYWNNGNKNEFVVCVGINPENNQLIWHNSFSWSKDHKLESKVRNYLSSKNTFDCYAFCDWMESVVPNNWSRREFKEFNYLDTKLPIWANILIFTLSVITTVAVCIFGIY